MPAHVFESQPGDVLAFRRRPLARLVRRGRGAAPGGNRLLRGPGIPAGDRGGGQPDAGKPPDLHPQETPDVRGSLALPSRAEAPALAPPPRGARGAGHSHRKRTEKCHERHSAESPSPGTCSTRGQNLVIPGGLALFDRIPGVEHEMLAELLPEIAPGAGRPLRHGHLRRGPVDDPLCRRQRAPDRRALHGGRVRSHRRGRPDRGRGDALHRSRRRAPADGGDQHDPHPRPGYEADKQGQGSPAKGAGRSAPTTRGKG